MLLLLLIRPRTRVDRLRHKGSRAQLNLDYAERKLTKALETKTVQWTPRMTDKEYPYEPPPDSPSYQWDR